MAIAIVLLLAGALGWPWLRDLLGLAVPTLDVLAAICSLTALCLFWLDALRRLLIGRFSSACA